MSRKTALITAASLLLATMPALAQTQGPHGGLLQGKAGHQTELVVTPDQITVYLIDEGKAHPIKGVSLRAVVQVGGKNSTVEMKPDGEKLVGKLAVPLGKGAIVVLTGKDDHGDAISTRYVMK